MIHLHPLFDLKLEIFSYLLYQAPSDSAFHYYLKCIALQITYLLMTCFYLLEGIRIMINSLKQFNNMACLHANHLKSKTCLIGVDNNIIIGKINF